ncbi:MAG: AAA family ATPase [Micromonosporaceae bacterium]|nr:AAA family ATPase [Micromonosporaceae bacterium]
MTRTQQRAVTHTPHELARLLRLPRPTPQQAEVIAVPLEPVLVVAGAGSGKTETMAARVLYLIANDLVRPEQVLGLTFTRKAAGELAKRVRQRLAQLARTPEFATRRADSLAGEPTVLTYHAYAARLAAEHGVRSGYEPGARLLTEAACWQLADSVVRTYDGDMSQVHFAVATVTKAMLDLSAGLAEHLRAPHELADFTEKFAAEIFSRSGKMLAPVEKCLTRQAARAQLLPLAEAYAERKRDTDALDFADQMARAAITARDHPGVGEIERDRYRVVLLDEYQDTSHAQVVLLRSLFGGGHPVTAVGDPCQSIYGWRGASAGTLQRFSEDFPRADGAPTPWARRVGDSAPSPAQRLPLSVSWRNRPEILRVANGLSDALRTGDDAVEALRAAQPPTAGAATPRLRVVGAEPHRPPTDPVVRCALLATVLAEAQWLADRFAAAWEEPGVGQPTAAVLVRTRRQIPLLESALRARGLPVEVVGLGGLLDTPEVREIVCTLRVLADPADGASLLRLLAGPRWRIGPRDIVALHRRARALAEHRRRLAQAEDGSQAAGRRLDESALTEALADLGPADRYSADGHRRLRMLGAELRGLWSRADQSLPDLVADVERTVGLDVEVAARQGDAVLARGHLDTFADVAARFAAESAAPTLSAFLGFCEAAERSERGLEPGKVEVVEGAVQLLTVHAAKGLEWDVVAVAGLCGGVFPTRQQADHWVSQPGVLPFELRGDSSGLPELDLGAAHDQRGVRDALDDFEEAWREHSRLEERRLAYVAVTRPRRLLLCSGYWWDDVARRRRGPSEFLAEIRDLCWSGAGAVDAWVDEPDPDAENPLMAQARTTQWPIDPLGVRRPVQEEAADWVRAELAALEAGAGGGGADEGVAVVGGDAAAAAGQEAVALVGGDAVAAVGDDAVAVVGGDAVAAVGDEVVEAIAEEERRWAHEVDLLLAERDAAEPDTFEVALPESISVSTLVSLRRDPERLAARLRRPLPERPNPYARRGTAFHQWIEQRHGGQRLLDLDELPGAGDDDLPADEELAALQKAFEASDWADRTPAAVEVPFTSVVAGVVLRGRMDAVFRDADGGYDVIDWKTGRRPTGRDAEAAAMQLAAYRLAWAELAGVDVETVRAGFHYVPESVTVRPADLLDADGLVDLIATLPERSPR